MSASETSTAWDFTHVIDLLHSFKLEPPREPAGSLRNSSSKLLQPVSNDTKPTPPEGTQCRSDDSGRLGDFSSLWGFLSNPSLLASGVAAAAAAGNAATSQIAPVANGLDAETLEATVERHTQPEGTKADKIILNRRNSSFQANLPQNDAVPATPVRPSIQILRNPDARPTHRFAQASQETLKLNGRAISDSVVKAPPILPVTPSKSSLKNRFLVEAKLTGSAAERKAGLIELLRTSHKAQKQFLSNPKLCDPRFVSSNVSPNGIHVFVDTSNVSPVSILPTVSVLTRILCR